MSDNMKVFGEVEGNTQTKEWLYPHSGNHFLIGLDANQPEEAVTGTILNVGIGLGHGEAILVVRWHDFSFPMNEEENEQFGHSSQARLELIEYTARAFEHSRATEQGRDLECFEFLKHPAGVSRLSYPSIRVVQQEYVLLTGQNYRNKESWEQLKNDAVALSTVSGAEKNEVGSKISKNLETAKTNGTFRRLLADLNIPEEKLSDLLRNPRLYLL